MELFLFEYPRFVKVSRTFQTTVKRNVEKSKRTYKLNIYDQETYYALGVMSNLVNNRDYSKILRKISKKYRIDYAEYMKDTFFEFNRPDIPICIIYDNLRRTIFLAPIRTESFLKLIWE